MLRSLQVVVASLFLVFPQVAAAFPWMIQHQYTQCAQCHVDPSGGSALTDYGRAQGEILLRTHYDGEAEEPGAFADFLFGALPLPDPVIAQADVRGMFIPRPGNFQTILMQSDLRVGVQTDLITAYASVGVVDGSGALGARVFQEQSELLNVVSRDHWIGVTPVDGLTIRAGRINLPFGVRTENHILFTRAITRTTINDDQQHGLAVAYAKDKWRGEIMGIAGNLQVSPDAYRERGYSGYLAYAPSLSLEIGASSLLASADLDVATLAPLTRQAHGVFARWAPIDHVALMGEADVLLNDGGPDVDGTTGFVTELEADWEAKQGVHVKAGGGACDSNLGDDAATQGRGWAAFQWFFLPRVDVRIDALVGPLYCVPGAESRAVGMAQLHFYL